jgi:hypothetical protein
MVAITGTLPGGAYTLDGVPAGSVDVRFDASGGCPGGITANFVTQWFNNQTNQASADAVSVVAGATTPSIDAIMSGGSSITGTVTGGGGLSGICVAAVDPTTGIAVASTATNGSGAYTLNAVPAGSFKVRFDASGVCPGGVSKNYATEWYNNKPAMASANPVNVAAGATTPNINAALVGGTSFSISVNTTLSATINRGEVATLSESGLPNAATGTVVFSGGGHSNLCTITLPATSCHTSATLPVGSYSPISAVFTPGDTNFVGSTSANTVALTVLATAPGVPTHVHAAPGDGKVIVTWSAPTNNGGSSITGYKVTTTPGGKSVSVPASASSADITGLKPGTYRFTVRAVNGAGSSAWSSSSNAITIVTVAGNPPRVGYWMLGADGKVYAFGDSKPLGNAPGSAVAIASLRNGKGYWVVDAAGRVRHFGTAAALIGRPALRSGERVSAMSGTPSGKGYWLFTNLGHAFAYGDAHFYGDVGSTRLNGAVIASAATATGHGYYMVGSDGGVFAFNAPFRGSMGATRLNKPVNGLVAFGNGYLMVASDGGVFTFSNKPFLGSLGSNPPANPIIGISAFTTN